MSFSKSWIAPCLCGVLLFTALGVLAGDDLVIPVRVLDRDKNPVTGLSADQFSVKLDGDKLSISDVTDLSAEDQADAARKYVLFFDLRFNNERGVMSSRDAALHFIQKEKKPADRVAVFLGTAQRGIVPLADFTSDAAKLQAVISGLGLVNVPNAAAVTVSASAEGPMIPGLLRNVDKDQFFANGFSLASSDASPAEATEVAQPSGNAELDSALLDKVRDQLAIARRQESRDADTEVVGYVENLRVLARGIVKEPGCKNLVMFTGGFDNKYLLGGSTFDMVRDAEASLTGSENVSGNAMGDASLQSRVDDLIRDLQATGSMVYIMDTSGLDTSDTGRSNSQILNTLSSDTGGRLFSNENDFAEPMNRVAALANQVYLVSAARPSGAENGKLLRMKVSVDRSRVKLTAPKYWLLSDGSEAPQAATNTERPSQKSVNDYLSGGVDASDLPVQLSVVSVPERNGLYRLSVEVHLEAGYFAGIDDDKLALEFAVAAETDGQLQDRGMGQYQLKFDKVAEQARADGLRYVTALLVTGGENKVRAVVRNAGNGQAATAEKTVLSESKSGRVKAVMVKEKAPLTLNDPREDLIGGVDVNYPFAIGNSTFVPVEEMKGDAAGKGRFFFTVGECMPSNGNPPNVRALVREPGQQPVVLSPDSMQIGYRRNPKPTSVQPVLMIVDFAKLGLKPGKSYELMTQIILADGKALRTITPFQL